MTMTMKTPGMIGDLKSLLGPGSVESEPGVLSALSRDWWSQALWWDEQTLRRHTPSALLRPESAEDLSKAMIWAGQNGVAVIPRGGGSGVCGAAIPSGPDSLVVDTTRLNKVLAIEAGESPSVRAQAGIFGGDLEAAVNRSGYSLMHFPASLEISTLGGWIATGSYGQLSTLYGGIGDQLESVRAVLADGSIHEGSPRDFLLSEGALAVITEARVRLRKKPQRHHYLSCEFQEMEEGLNFLWSLLEQGIKPAVARFYDPLEAKSSGLAYARYPFLTEEMRFRLRTFLLKHPNLIQFLRMSGLAGRRWLLVLVFDESQGPEHSKALAEVRKERIKSSSKQARLWMAKRSQWNTSKMKTLFDQGCFVDTLDVRGSWGNLGDVYSRVIEAASPYALAMGHISHFTKEGACLYFIFAGRGKSPGQSVWLHHSAWRSAMEACISAGGLVNHHHGVGLAKRPWRKNAYQKGWLEGFASRKKIFDPKGIMNPGKVL